jgi:phage shock protein C
MSTRTRTSFGTSLVDDLDALETASDAELEQILFREEEPPASKLNLATFAGLGMMGVGALYILQTLGLSGISVGGLVSVLPWIAGVLIFALGFGLFRRRPKSTPLAASARVKPRAQALNSEARRTDTRQSFGVGMAPRMAYAKRRLTKSQDRKIAGVAGGIAERFGWDPTIVRIAWIAAAIASSGIPVITAYILLALFMPKPQALSAEERIAIIRNS